MLSTRGLLRCRRAILVDFFRHAFDGSGADNFFDAGSCIDGRLTSAWNWCSKIEKKDYYPVFKLAGARVIPTGSGCCCVQGVCGDNTQPPNITSIQQFCAWPLRARVP